MFLNIKPVIIGLNTFDDNFKNGGNTTGLRIRELRKQKYLKVSDVADFMGFVSEQAIYKWQRGDSLPTVDNLYALSQLFETSIDNIIKGDKEEDENPSLPVYPNNLSKAV